MSYYPILKAPDCYGWATLYNFPANNWESKDFSEKFVNLTWAENGKWRSENIDRLAPESIRTIHFEEVSGIVSNGALPLLSLSKTKLPARSDKLPLLDIPKTIAPAWRATLGLSTSQAQTSFQGGLDAFPTEGTLLTFGPFIQFGLDIKNYIILLNIENSATSKSAEVEIYDAALLKLRGRFLVNNNSANCIRLDGLGFEPSDLPLIICRGMAAIPLYFSSAMNGSYLSLEHTHPPGSLVVHGRRWEAQKMLKNRWFAKAAP